MEKNDRIAISLKIVTSDQEIKGIDLAKNTLSAQQQKVQNLDIANKNLMDPYTVFINKYQSEYNNLSGNVHSVILEQDILDAANKKFKNHFFPNDVSTSVPSLSGSNNVWTKINPFALTYAIGKNYTESYDSTTPKESDVIQNILNYIISASSYMDIENTTGQHCTSTSGSCSIPTYTDQTSCVSHSGVWTPGSDVIATFPDVQTLKTNIVSAVNSLISILNNELANIVTNDADPTIQSQNNAAINNISNVILPALNSWISYPDFNTVPPSVTSCASFYSYNPATLAPTKLHSTELSVLQNALNSRLSFSNTRKTQLESILGTINQDLSTGNILSGSGLYLKRYNVLSIRINALNGSLTQLAGFTASINAQETIKNNISSSVNFYQTVLPTSGLKSNGNGTNIIHVLNSSLFSVNNLVYIMAENQEEIKRAIKSINGDSITLNDIVPIKYRTSDKARIYKENS